MRSIHKIISLRREARGLSTEKEEEAVRETLFGSPVSPLVTAAHSCDTLVAMLKHGQYFRLSEFVKLKWVQENLLGTFGGVSIIVC